MPIEQEIKLALPPAHTETAMRFFTARAGCTGWPIRLENIYFDTRTLTLARAKSALRLRRTPDGWLQTLKTAGSAKNGLHARHEWEIPVAGPALEIERLLCEYNKINRHAGNNMQADIATTLRNAATALIPLFRTDFTRTLWQLHMDDAHIEAAIDQGEIIAEINDGVNDNVSDDASDDANSGTPRTRRAPISEIELELKHGDPAALHRLAAQLVTQLPGLVPDNVSKAQRGYGLREGKSRKYSS